MPGFVPLDPELTVISAGLGWGTKVVPFGDVVTVVVVTEPLDVPLSQEAKKTVHIHIIRKKDNIFFIPRLLVILFWGKYII